MVKTVFRFDQSWPKFRLFRVIRNIGTVGDGVGYSHKIAVALRPRLASWQRDWDGFRVTVFGIEIHSQRSYGGIFV